MVVTDEPGIYIHDFGGVRIEDLVVVTKDGCKVLSKSPKNLIEL
jgi:Xaa-Pro aminopeptidase